MPRRAARHNMTHRHRRDGVTRACRRADNSLGRTEQIVTLLRGRRLARSLESSPPTRIPPLDGGLTFMKRILVVLAVLAAFGATAEAGPNGADLEAALVRCADVTFPAPLTGCGDDPLTRGRVEINQNGDVAAA